MSERVQENSRPSVDVLLSDVDIARAITVAICRVPGVLEMSPGLFAQEATYGPHEHVSGVVIHRPSHTKLVIDVHVVISEAFVVKACAESSLQGSDAEQQSPLLHLATQIRATVTKVAHDLNIRTLNAVNVQFDDVR